MGLENKAISLKVRVNRNRSPLEALLEAADKILFMHPNILNTMPKASADEVEVIFFKPDYAKHGRRISDDELEKEYTVHGFKPADPYTLAAVNEDYPAFADSHPNATHWKDSNGNWYCAAFCRLKNKRLVFIERRDDGLREDQWFAAFRA